MRLNKLKNADKSGTLERRFCGRQYSDIGYVGFNVKSIGFMRSGNRLKFH